MTRLNATAKAPSSTLVEKGGELQEGSAADSSGLAVQNPNEPRERQGLVENILNQAAR